MALFKIYNNIDNPRVDQQTGEPILPSTYNKGYMYFDANTNIFYIDTAGTGGTTGTRVKLNSWGAYKAFRSEGIPYGIVDNNNSTSAAFHTTIPEITGLENGTIILLRNDYITSAANFTLTIHTIDKTGNNKTLGPKPVYSNIAPNSSIIFKKNDIMLFIYDTTKVTNGCWICYTGVTSAETANQLTHTLTIGNYTFDGSEDVTIPVYDGTYTLD